MRRPVDAPYTLTTEFGVPDTNAFFGKHSGVDYAVGIGTRIYAPVAGRVVYAQNHSTGGMMLIIHDGKFFHRLMHLSRFSVALGDTVKEAQLIGLSGNSGLSTGPHLHWDVMTEMVSNATPRPRSFAGFVDPWVWLQGAQAPAPVTTDVLKPNQRRVGLNGVNYRTGASVNASIIQEYPAGDILDFKGFIKGEPYSDNNIWFVGQYTGGYAWSGSFTDPGTNGLEDLTPAAPAPVQNSVKPNGYAWGIDVSSHQGDIDFEKLRSANLDFAIIKAGHTGPSFGGGHTKTDPRIAQNVSGFMQIGVPVGFYWYCYFDEDAMTEGRHFAAAVQGYPGSLWADIEEESGANPVWVQTFIDTVETITKRKVHVYTYHNYAVNHPWIGDIVKDRVLWLAHYGKTPGQSVNDTPAGIATIHQYSSTGKLDGINTNVDLNISYVSKGDLIMLGNTIKDHPTGDTGTLPIGQPAKEPLPEGEPPAPLPTKENNPVRPKVRAGLTAGAIATLLTTLALAFGVDLPEDAVEQLTAGALALGTLVSFLAAYMKRDGLSPK